MSNSLVHKSLELFGYNKDLRKEQKKKRKKRKQVEYKGILDLIPTKHRFISEDNNLGKYTTLNRSKKATVYETQKRIATQEDATDKNVQQLLLLSNNRIKPKTADKLLHHAIKKKYSIKQEKPKETEATAFTEEDFKKFEQEYVE